MSARVDWFMVIMELETIGISLAKQAQHCLVAKGTVSYWKQGGEPKHCDGGQLLGLYAKHFPDRSTPMQMVKNLDGTSQYSVLVGQQP